MQADYFYFLVSFIANWWRSKSLMGNNETGPSMAKALGWTLPMLVGLGTMRSIKSTSLTESFHKTKTGSLL